MDGGPLRFREGEYVTLGYCDDFTALLRAIDEAMPMLWAHDAGDGYLLVSPSLPEATVERLRASLGPALRLDD